MLLEPQQFKSIKGISKVAAKIYYSSRLNEFCIENVGKNPILIDKYSLKRAGAFRVLRNEACIQISGHTMFFILPKEILYKKKLLRESRKHLMLEKLSKLNK